MGAWSSILPTITYDLYQLQVIFSGTFTLVTSEQVLVDLGIGPDSSNVTNVADFLLAGSASDLATSQTTPRIYDAPLFIPAGTQLWARCQSNIVSNTVVVNARGWGGPDRPASFPVVFKWEPEGEDAAASIGTAITPGNAAQGAYTQMTASSAFDYVGAMLSCACQDTTMSSDAYTGGIGIGAATEQDLGTCLDAGFGSSEIINSHSRAVLADIPPSTRIAARMACTAAPDATISAIVYGLRA
jgi:hypothetical protein